MGGADVVSGSLVDGISWGKCQIYEQGMDMNLKSNATRRRGVIALEGLAKGQVQMRAPHALILAKQTAFQK